MTQEQKDKGIIGICHAEKRVIKEIHKKKMTIVKILKNNRRMSLQKSGVELWYDVEIKFAERMNIESNFIRKRQQNKIFYSPRLERYMSIVYIDIDTVNNSERITRKI